MSAISAVEGSGRMNVPPCAMHIASDAARVLMCHHDIHHTMRSAASNNCEGVTCHVLSSIRLMNSWQTIRMCGWGSASYGWQRGTHERGTGHARHAPLRRRRLPPTLGCQLLRVRALL